MEYPLRTVSLPEHAGRAPCKPPREALLQWSRWTRDSFPKSQNEGGFVPRSNRRGPVVVRIRAAQPKEAIDLAPQHLNAPRRIAGPDGQLEDATVVERTHRQGIDQESAALDQSDHARQ